MDEKNERNEKKIFVKGMAAGIAAVIIFNTFFSALSMLYNRFYATELSINDKISMIYSVLDQNYIEPYDKEELVETMYYGLVKGVGDRYTSYMDRNTLASFIEQSEGTYAGIGVMVELDENVNAIMVAVPFEGMPGEQAGLLAGDILIKVNGMEVDGDMFPEIPDLLKGPPGTSVTVTVYRPDEEATLDFTIVRQEVVTPTVYYKLLRSQIGYIRISNFERHTYEQFMNAYQALNNANIQGLIIDVRNNPGGYLNVVTDIANELVPQGYIVYTEDKKGNKEYIYSDEKHIEVPLAIVVNGDSASASEVLSGAVKDLGTGVLVGTKTFGKGLVQNLFTLPDQSGIKVTIAKYYTPSGVCINGIGIEPDYVVELSEALSRKFYKLDLEEDTQLMKAVEVIEEKIGY